jgi:2-polyprenyl-3-methyl-5-hydroxy-6-metoxy-1,4-benzoquinol methylase
MLPINITKNNFHGRDDMSDSKIDTDRIAKKYLDQDDSTGWFEEVYSSAKKGGGQVPWARLGPHVDFIHWAIREKVNGKGKKALKVGCGLGDDAEELSQRNFNVTAFDISETAIDWCYERFPESKVNYIQADLFNDPPQWKGGFDFVLEIYTLQSLPKSIRQKAIKKIAGFVAPGGHLLVINICRDEDVQAGDNPPWPLTRQEVLNFKSYGLVLETEENFISNHFETPRQHSRMLFSRS